MGFISITKTRKPRQFQYIPRYYDERKERLQALIERAQKENGEMTEGGFSAARMQLEFQEARAKRTKRTAKAQQRRTLLILGALVLLLYLYFRL
jgi:hypothetical protein